MAKELHGIFLGRYMLEPDAKREMGQGLVYRQCHNSDYKQVPGSDSDSTSVVLWQYLPPDDEDKPLDLRDWAWGNRHCYLYRWKVSCPASVNITMCYCSLVHSSQDRQLLEGLA